jgi:hypothetical protein
LHKAERFYIQVVTLLAHGCPVPAIVAAFGLDERTVGNWQRRAASHCQAVQTHLVERGRDLGEVQCDEIRVRTQGGRCWLAMALEVRTRLWLGARASRQRDDALINSLLELVKGCALCRDLLFCVDGLASYLSAIQAVFREPDRAAGQCGRPPLLAWPRLYIAQVIKRYEQRRVTGIERRIVQGTAAEVEAVRQAAEGAGVLNTAFIERLNGTFRGRVAALARRTHALLRLPQRVEQAAYLVGTVYNFCCEHKSLRLPGLVGGHKWLERTPALAAGITDHCWTVHELLAFHVPPPPWQPPKRRGRRSKALQALIKRWRL